jgi:hypothetical protein
VATGRQDADSELVVYKLKDGVPRTDRSTPTRLRGGVDAGARVALGARPEDHLPALVGQLGGDHAVAVPGDVRVPQYNEALVAAAVDRCGRLCRGLRAVPHPKRRR